MAEAGQESAGQEPGPGGGLTGRAWLAALPDELAAQRHVMAALADCCQAWPLARSLLVGCSLGRGAADALSDVDAALGVDAEPGAGAQQIESVETLVLAALPGVGALIDVLRHPAGPSDQWVRRIFAQFADGTQLDLAIVADADIRARQSRGGAPDFIPLYQAPGPPGPPGPPRPPPRPAAGPPGGPARTDPDLPAGIEPRAAYQVTGDQVREWAFLGWHALLDMDKYLRRGSLWEAHNRLHEARHRIWTLWAAANGAMYPWHGLSQVLDHDPGHLPPGIEATVAGLDTTDLYRAARASADVLAAASDAAARRHPADLPSAMAAYVTRVLAAGSSAREEERRDVRRY